MKQVEIIEKMTRLFPDQKITQQQLSAILNGKRRPSWSTAKVLGDITGTDPAFWMEKPPEVLKRVVSDLAA